MCVTMGGLVDKERFNKTFWDQHFIFSFTIKIKQFLLKKLL